MARLDGKSRELHVKIVYYGPALSGKTTNILALHDRLDPERQTSLLSINTREDRTLFFDLLPVDLGTVRGFRVRFRVYTVPGQVHYGATRRLVLSGADGVVAVMDSDPERALENPKSLEDLLANLEVNGIDPATLPIVVQWNKRDLPRAVALPLLERAIEPHRHSSFEAVATRGQGVIETFARAVELTLEGLSRKLSMKELAPLGPALKSRIEACPAPSAATPKRVVVAPQDTSHGTDESRHTMQMLSFAVKSAVKTAEAAVDQEDGRRRAESERDQLKTLAEVSQRLVAGDLEGGLRHALDGARALMGADGAALSLFDENGGVASQRLSGLEREPLAAIAGPGGGSLLRDVIRAGKPWHVEDLERELVFSPVVDGRRLLLSACAVPVVMDGQPRGALSVYSSDPGRPIKPEALPALELLASHLALALEQDQLRATVTASRRDWIATVDALSDPVYVVDRAFKLVRVNRAFADAVGLHPKQVVGRTCHQVLFGRSEPCARCFVRAAMDRDPASPPLDPVELDEYLPSRTVEARALPLPHAGDAPTFLATLHDITRIKAMTRQLTESEKLAALGRLAGGMAHEINNPLGSIAANLDYVDGVLEKEAPKRESLVPAREAISEGRQAVERVRRIVKDLRRYSQADECKPVSMSIVEVVRRSAHAASQECRRPDVTVLLAEAASVPVMGYPMKLGMVLLAILKNAIEASPQGGKVRVAVSMSGPLARVAVRDQGEGIPPENLGRVFDPFFTTKRIGQHLGLSLSVAYSLVRGMGGTIEAASGPSGGSTFTVTVPLRLAESRVEATPRLAAAV